MSPTLEDQERHLLVKVIDRVLYKLDDLVRPYVHKVRPAVSVTVVYENHHVCAEEVGHIFLWNAMIINEYHITCMSSTVFADPAD